jgi:hypothetical protein
LQKFYDKLKENIQAWWYMYIILALSRLKQEDLNFKASLGYIVRSCLTRKEKGKGRDGGKEREGKGKKGNGKTGRKEGRKQGRKEGRKEGRGLSSKSVCLASMRP